MVEPKKMVESSSETARGHGGALDVNVFAKIKGGGSGQPYSAVMAARSGHPKPSGYGGSRTSLDDGWGNLRWGSISGDSSYGGGRSWESSSRRGIDMGGDAKAGWGHGLELGAATWCLCQNGVIGGRFYRGRCPVWRARILQSTPTRADPSFVGFQSDSGRG
jgi:hypothetical protein